MFWILLGCTDPKPTEQDTSTAPEYDPAIYLDLRVEVPPAPEGGIEIRTPIIEVQPYTEVILCYFGHYEGPTVGIDFMQTYQSNEFSHHNQLKISTAFEPDGTLVDCNYLASGVSMSEFVPMFEAVGVTGLDSQDNPNVNWLNYPEGVATKLKSGQKWVLEMHYINTTDKIAIVNNGVNLGVVPENEVRHFAGSAQFDSGPPQIQPGIDDDSFDCKWRESVTVLSLSGHMHSTGTKFSVEHIKQDGSRSIIYDIPEWDGSVQPYFPTIITFEPGELEVEQGDIFRTYCEWNNPTNDVLTFPTEMCTTAVVAYPLDKPLSCIDGVYYD